MKLITQILLLSLLFASPAYSKEDKPMDEVTQERYERWCNNHPKRCEKVTTACANKPKKCNAIKKRRLKNMTQLERHCDKNDNLCGILKKEFNKHHTWCKENKQACRKKLKAKRKQEKHCAENPDDCLQDIGLSSFPEQKELKDALAETKKAESN